ncbi:MAG: dUTP diphosphatase [Alphaproteobacteria bacterium]|nr:dUTP diphosphatase [Alphaproteobacteria bacterium]
MPKLGIIRLAHSVGLDLPSYKTFGASGLDLAAAVPSDEDMVIAAGERGLVPTGLIFELPEGYEMQIRPRSGLALNHGISCPNSPGTIDNDYRGEVKVLLINLGKEPFVIKRGMRIAQAVLAPFFQVKIEEREQASPTKRGDSGFGSTGV